MDEKMIEQIKEPRLEEARLSYSIDVLEGTVPAQAGPVTPFIADKKVAELADVRAQNGKFSLCGEGLNIGRDGGAPVTYDYPFERPWGIVGATIERVIVDVSGEAYLDLERAALAMMKRD
jgi:hypothetical protein